MTTQQLERAYDGRIPTHLLRLARAEDERRSSIKHRLMEAAAGGQGAQLTPDDVLSLTAMVQERHA